MSIISDKELEEVLKNGTPSDLYLLIPAHARGRIAAFVQCFGITPEDIAYKGAGEYGE